MNAKIKFVYFLDSEYTHGGVNSIKSNTITGAKNLTMSPLLHIYSFQYIKK